MNMAVVDIVISVAIMIVGILFGGGLIAFGLIAYFQHKKYNQFDFVIWGRDSFGQLVEEKDTGGIFVDKKTNNKRLFLKKNNVGLDPDNVPYISIGGRKKVYLLKLGLKNFRYIKPKVDFNGLAFIVGEEDVNWAINSYERQKKVFGQNWLLQYLPFMALAFVSIIILIMFIYFFKQFPVLKDIALAMKEAAQQLAAAQGGTVILQ